MVDLEKCDSITSSQRREESSDRNSSEWAFPQWFAIAVKPRFDKAVARALETKGYETLLPLYKRRHNYGTRYKEFELPLFPGYVFCRFNPSTRLSILTTSGVKQILGNGSRTSALSEIEITSLRAAMNERLPLEPFPFLQSGQRVRIEQGSLEGLEGIVIRSKPSLRLVLSVTLLQRSVLLEIDQDQVNVHRFCQLPDLPPCNPSGVRVKSD